jgi:hypothetical protein
MDVVAEIVDTLCDLGRRRAHAQPKLVYVLKRQVARPEAGLVARGGDAAGMLVPGLMLDVIARRVDHAFTVVCCAS